eukprot:6618209-Pyramimonas_sp.AAC.1
MPSGLRCSLSPLPSAPATPTASRAPARGTPYQQEAPAKARPSSGGIGVARALGSRLRQVFRSLQLCLSLPDSHGLKDGAAVSTLFTA